MEVRVLCESVVGQVAVKACGSASERPPIKGCNDVAVDRFGQAGRLGMCAKLPIWQLGLLSWRYGNLAFRRSCQCPVGTQRAHQRTEFASARKKGRKKEPVAPPDAPPLLTATYREAISGRKHELDQEATPGRRNFFYRSIRSKPKL
jgi:hypothetical protein